MADLERVLGEDQGAELGVGIAEVVLAADDLELGVKSRHRDVVELDLIDLSSALSNSWRA